MHKAMLFFLNKVYIFIQSLNKVEFSKMKKNCIERVLKFSGTISGNLITFYSYHMSRGYPFWFILLFNICSLTGYLLNLSPSSHKV